MPAAAAAAAARRRDPLAEVHAALSLGAVPAVLPCRDAEKRQLAAFAEKAIRGGASRAGGRAGEEGLAGRGLGGRGMPRRAAQAPRPSKPSQSETRSSKSHPTQPDGGVLYVCGVPGTGKTACMVEVLASLRGRAKAAGTQFVSLNCLQLPSPQHVYSKLWERLSGQQLGPARCGGLGSPLGGFVSLFRRQRTQSARASALRAIPSPDCYIAYQHACTHARAPAPLPGRATPCRPRSAALAGAASPRSSSWTRSTCS